MKHSYRRIVRQELNKILNLAGFELKKLDDNHQNYINLRKTLLDAGAAGLSLGDYIDITFNVPGATQATIENMAGLGIFQQTVERVCEIGPGSGRYLEKIISICHPQYYEIYET